MTNQNQPSSLALGDDDEITAVMREEGAARLDALTATGGQLLCSPSYVAQEVYLAMRKSRRR
jgi:hypothetical protein